MVGVSMSDPKQPNWAKPTSSSSTITTLGAPVGARVGSGHHGSDSWYHRPTPPPNSSELHGLTPSTCVGPSAHAWRVYDDASVGRRVEQLPSGVRPNDIELVPPRESDSLGRRPRMVADTDDGGPGFSGSTERRRTPPNRCGGGFFAGCAGRPNRLMR